LVVARLRVAINPRDEGELAGGSGVWQCEPSMRVGLPVTGAPEGRTTVDRSAAEEDKVEEAVCSLPGDDEVVSDLMFQT